MIYMIIILILAAILTISVLIILRQSNTKQKIYATLQELGETVAEKKDCYDYKLTRNDTIYLIKIIYNYSKLEISVNNKNHWELNDKVVASKKSGTKLEGIYDLINKQDFSFELPMKKVYLIYPSSKVLLKAVNESELNFIQPNTDCYGVHLIKYDEINQAINEI